jgi:hypothetical protein
LRGGHTRRNGLLRYWLWSCPCQEVYERAGFGPSLRHSGAASSAWERERSISPIDRPTPGPPGQNGRPNESALRQNGRPDEIALSQNGRLDRSSSSQNGRLNESPLGQNGRLDRSSSSQNGRPNESALGQNGRLNRNTVCLRARALSWKPGLSCALPLITHHGLLPAAGGREPLFRWAPVVASMVSSHATAG